MRRDELAFPGFIECNRFLIAFNRSDPVTQGFLCKPQSIPGFHIGTVYHVRSVELPDAFGIVSSAIFVRKRRDFLSCLEVTGVELQCFSIGGGCTLGIALLLKNSSQEMPGIRRVWF